MSERQSNAGMELFRIVSVFAAGGTVAMGGYALAQMGLLDLAASGIAMYFATLGRLFLAHGVLSLPAADNPDASFAGIRAIGRVWADDYQKFLVKRKAPALALVAVGYTAAFLVFRQVCSIMLSAFDNLWVMGTFGLALTTIVLSPHWVPLAIKWFKQVGEANDKTVDSAPAPAPVPAPVQPAPAPRPAAAAVRSVRRNDGWW